MDYARRKPSHRRRISRARREAFHREKRDTIFQVFSPLVFFICLMAYVELVFHIAIFKSAFTFLPLVLPACVGATFALFSILTPNELANKIIGLVWTSLTCILCVAEIIYNGVFVQTFFQLFSISGEAGQALDFVGLIMEQFWKNIITILFLLAPIAVYCILAFRKSYIISFRKKKPMVFAYYFAIILVTFLFGRVCLLFGGKSDDSPYHYYVYNNDVNEEVRRLGVITTTRIDLRVLLFGAKDQGGLIDPDDLPNGEIPTLPGVSVLPTIPSTQKPTQEEIPTIDYVPTTDENGETTPPPETEADPPQNTWDTSPNIMNIDFEYLNSLTTDEAIRNMNNYFASQVPTLKNQYTGMFKGYNVIYICAEGFWKYAVDPERTPTLYKLANEGFVFNHYYTPLWYGSTSGGEFATLTGTLPKNGGYVSLAQTGKLGTNMYMSIAKRLTKSGYYAFAAHNNSNTYYSRNLSLPNMGFSEFFATGSGYQPEVSSKGKDLWPQSDNHLVTQLLPKYVGKEPFINYIMTVSGHCNYEKKGNSMAYRNWSLVENLPYKEEETKGYIAAHYELEKALTTLIAGLEEQGILDRTLIVLTGDHVPYNDKHVCDELAGHTLDEGVEWYESTLIMWSHSMKEPVYVDKYCYQCDILPTVYNLLGIEYDSRMLVGQDILSTSSQLVIFKNGSFITDHCIYNGLTGEITQLTDYPIDDAYIKAYKKYINAKWAISEMFINNNYYDFFEKNYKE